MKNSFFAPEALEARIAPAAVFVDASTLTVTFSAAGALKIVPKTANASVEVSIQQLEDGDFLISDAEGDDDLEETANFTGNITSLTVTLGNGDDLVDLALLGTNGFRGPVTINTNLGDDTIVVSEGLLRGPLTIATRGSADIAIGQDDADLTVKGAVTVNQVGGSLVFGENAIAGALTANGANGLELLGTVFGAASLKAAPTGGAFALGSLGPDSPAYVKGALTITGSAVEDSLELANIQVRGALSANLGAGANTTTAGAGLRVDGAARFAGALGTDEFTFGSLADGGPRFNGLLTISSGASGGANVAEVFSGIYAGGITFAGGNGDDQVVLGSTTTSGPAVYGRLNVALSNATNGNSLAVYSGTYSGGAGIGGGAGNDVLIFGSATTTGPTFQARVNLSAGIALTSNQTQIFSGMYAGGLALTAGNADDVVTLGAIGTDGPQFYARVALGLGSAVAANTLNVVTGFFGAGLGVSSGAGADNLTFGSELELLADLSIAAAGGANTVSVGTFDEAIRFTYTGGAGADLLTLGGQGSGFVIGAVTLGDGADGLTVAPTAGDFFLSFNVDGGAATDAATVPSGVLAAGFVLKKFETLL